MGILFRFFIAQLMVLSQIYPYISYAQSSPAYYMPEDTFRDTNHRNQLTFGADANGKPIPNHYRLLGFPSFPDITRDSFRLALKSENLFLTQDLKNIKDHPKYKQLILTVEGQTELMRQQKSAFSTISFNRGGENFNTTYKELQSKLLEQASKDYAGPRRTEQDLRTMRRLTNIEANRQLLLTEVSLEEKRLANEQLRESKKILSTPGRLAPYLYQNSIMPMRAPHWSASLNPANQVRNLMGYNTYKTLDPFGKEIKTYMPRSGEALKGLKNLDTTKAIQMLKSGGVGALSAGMEVSIFAAILYLFMGIQTSYQMVYDFESNPMAFMEAYDMAPLLMTSSVGFALGGWGTSMGVDFLRLDKKAIKQMNFLMNEGKVAISNPALRGQTMKATMSVFKSSLIQRATTYSGLAGGFIISQIAMKTHDHFRSCSRMLKADFGGFPKYKRDQMEDSCKNGFWKISKAITSDPHVWKGVLAILLSKKAMMMLGAAPATLAKYGFSPNMKMDAFKRMAAKLPANSRLTNSKILIKFGQAARWGRTVAAPTIIGFVGFMVVFHFFEKLLSWGLELYEYNLPAKKAAANLRAIMSEAEELGWDPEELCRKDSVFFTGKLEDSILFRERPEVERQSTIDFQLRNSVIFKDEFKYTTFLKDRILEDYRAVKSWGRETKCSKDLLSSFINHHHAINSKWRSKIISPIATTVQKWMEYTSSAINTYRSTKLFYRDLVDQIRTQKEQEPEIDFATLKSEYSDSSGRNLLKHNSALQAQYYNHPLPLFRSSLFFGYKYRHKGKEDEGQEEYPYPSIDHINTDWVARYSDRERKTYIRERLKSFKQYVLRDIARDLKNPPEDLAQDKKDIAVKVADKLLTGKIANMAEALNLLAEATEGEKAVCMGHALAGAQRTTLGYDTNCFFHFLHRDYLDEDVVWPLDQDAINDFAHKFMDTLNPYFAGYQRTTRRPFGGRALPMGQRYLMTYHKKFKNNGIDHLYYDSAYKGLTDYLAKQSVCGVDLENGETMLKNPDSWFVKKGWTVPEFNAPRIPLKSNVDVCSRGRRNDMNGVRWSQGWHEDYGFYSYMEDRRNPENNYGGYVEFMYREISDDVLNNFEGWWKEKVQPEFSVVLDALYLNYFKREFIDEKLAEAIETGNNNLNCYESCEKFEFEHKEGFAAAVKQEMDSYFSYYLEPLTRVLPVDLKYSNFEEGTQAEEASKKLMEDYSMHKAELYDILDFLSGRSEKLSSSKLTELYGNLLEELSARMSVTVESGTQSYEILRVRALESLFNSRWYELRTLFKADGEEAIKDMRSTLIDMINNSNSQMTEDERNAAKDKVETEIKALRDAYEFDENRAGKVLFTYDPTLLPNYYGVASAFNAIRTSFKSLVDAKALEHNITTVDQIQD